MAPTCSLAAPVPRSRYPAGENLAATAPRQAPRVFRPPKDRLEPTQWVPSKQQKMQILKFKPINLGIEPKQQWMYQTAMATEAAREPTLQSHGPVGMDPLPQAMSYRLEKHSTTFIYIYVCVCTYYTYIYIYMICIYTYIVCIYIYIRRLFSTVSSDKGHLGSRKISLMASSLKWPDDIVMAAMGCYGKVLISLASGLENQVNTSRETSYIR